MKIIKAFLRAIKGIIIFFVSFFVYFLAFSSPFPVDENNVIQVPDWFMFLGIAFAILSAILEAYISSKRRKKKQQREINSRSIGLDTKYPNKQEEICNKSLEQAFQKTDELYLDFEIDDLMSNAILAIFETRNPDINTIQRKFKLGYARAARIVDQMEMLGIIGEFVGSRKRKILVTKEEALQICHKAQIKKEINANNRSSSNYVDLMKEININQIIEDEKEWRRMQQGLSETEYSMYMVDLMIGNEFEDWCADLLEKNGFINVEVTQSSGDQGVDVLAQKDGIKYAIQCKCYSSDLGNTPVQEVNTGRMIYHCQIGVVMTNRYFTKGAKEAADASGILLWDRDKLQKMIESST